MKFSSITFKFLSLIIGAFIITIASVLFVADLQLTRIIDKSQNAVYSEKVDVIWKKLNRIDIRLQKTGLVEAYGEDFKQSAVNNLRQIYYEHTDQLVYPFILDRQARVVMHPVLAEGDMSLQKLGWKNKLISSGKGDFTATYKDVTKWYVYQEFSPWNWIIVYVMPRDVKYRDARTLLNTLVVVMTGISIFVIMVVSFLLIRFTRPIVRLTHVAAGIADGNLDQKIDTDGFDEVGKLARSLTRMRDAIKQQLKELKTEIADRKQLGKALKESENKYRLIAENVADVIWTMDMDLKFTYVSPSVYQLRGYTVEEAMAQALDAAIIPDSLEKAINIFYEKIELINAGNSEGWEPMVFETEQYHKNGSIVWTEINARLLPGSDNQPQGILGITRDITEYKRTREMMIQTEKMMSVGGLAAGMAHEINNPLAGMMQTAEVVSQRLTDIEMPANQRAASEVGISMDGIKAFMEKRNIPRMITVINESGQRMAGIVNNMLNFTRKVDTKVSSHTIADLLDKTLELASTDFDFKMVDIKKEYEDKLPPILCEGSKIQQVLLNVLSNGAQAMQEAKTKTPCFIIRTRYVKNDKMVSIEIEDNGPGMDEITQKRIFEPFFTTKPPGVGTGLGLSVSYFIIVENHGGEMRVVSSPGFGAKFIICLPLEGKKL